MNRGMKGVIASGKEKKPEMNNVKHQAGCAKKHILLVLLFLALLSGICGCVHVGTTIEITEENDGYELAPAE